MPSRPNAWTILGTSVQSADTAAEALDMANMRGWNVRLLGDVNATCVDETGVTTLKMPDTRANVRTNPITGETEYLGKVGRKYNPVDIEEHEDVLDMIRRESDATFHRAGAYDNGRRFFISMTLPEVLRIGGFDQHQMHVTLFGSHDASSSNSFHIGPTRLDCGNMQRFIIKGAQHSYSIPHTASAQVKIAEVHKALATLFDWQDAFEREANRMLNTPVSLGQFETLVNTIWPVPTSPGKVQRTNFQNRMDTLRTLFEDADTQESIRGTGWAAWNAFGEYLDHYARAKTAATRAARSLSDKGDVTTRKTEAYTNLLALAA
ncbi:hypothetical protein AN218_07590 [Streptomyces nanshensis]|uniref:DUF932 domain-containing protein n=2 Tax=Streptomyces nanshensis TaxID=518642 RepID=A0A1E7L8X4_9ACTN|nr:hypothetical protein AN218_07590 [Streptomyces nanshensis]